MRAFEKRAAPGIVTAIVKSITSSRSKPAGSTVSRNNIWHYSSIMRVIMTGVAPAKQCPAYAMQGVERHQCHCLARLGRRFMQRVVPLGLTRKTRAESWTNSIHLDLFPSIVRSRLFLFPFINSSLSLLPLALSLSLFFVSSTYAYYLF